MVSETLFKVKAYPLAPYVRLNEKQLGNKIKPGDIITIEFGKITTPEFKGQEKKYGYKIGDKHDYVVFPTHDPKAISYPYFSYPIPKIDIARWPDSKLKGGKKHKDIYIRCTIYSGKDKATFDMSFDDGPYDPNLGNYYKGDLGEHISEFVEAYNTYMDKKFIFLPPDIYKKLTHKDLKNVYVFEDKFGIINNDAAKNIFGRYINRKFLNYLMPRREHAYFPIEAWEQLKNKLSEKKKWELAPGAAINISTAPVSEFNFPKCIVCGNDDPNKFKGIGNCRIGYLEWFKERPESFDKGDLPERPTIHYDYALMCQLCGTAYPVLKDEKGKPKDYGKKTGYKKYIPSGGPMEKRAKCPLCGSKIVIIGNGDNIDIGNVYGKLGSSTKQSKLSEFYYNHIGACTNTHLCGHVFPFFYLGEFKADRNLLISRGSHYCPTCKGEHGFWGLSYKGGDIGDLHFFKKHSKNLPQEFDILRDFSLMCKFCMALYTTFYEEKGGEIQDKWKGEVSKTRNYKCKFCGAKKLYLVPDIDVGNISPKGDSKPRNKYADLKCNGAWICKECGAAHPVHARIMPEAKK